MYQRFDNAIAKALSSENSQYGASERGVAKAEARRAASENRVKAMNEASIGNVGFARMHDTASTRFHEDAEAMAHGRPPVHHPIGFYLSAAANHRRVDQGSAAEAETIPLETAAAA